MTRSSMRWMWVAPVVVSAGLLGCGARSEADLLAAATKRLEQKDPAGAAIELKNLLQTSPDNAKARLMLGQALLEAGDMAGAEIELRRAWELGGARDEVAPLLARTLLESGQWQKVVGEFSDQSLSDLDAMASLQGTLALAYLGLGNQSEAKAASARALQLRPESEAAVLVGARVKLAGGARDEAMAMLDAALMRKPDAIKPMLLKAEVLQRQRRADEAKPLFQRVLELDKTSMDARSNLVHMAIGAKQLDEADKLIKDMPNAGRPLGRFLQAQVAMAKGESEKARDLSLPLLKAMPNYLPLLRLAAGAHQQLGQTAEAENLLSQALKLAPEEPLLRRQYANLQLQNRAPGKALEALKPLLESGKADAETLLLAGKAQLMQGNFQAADDAFGVANKLRPDDAKLNAALALSTISRDNAGATGADKAKADAAIAQLVQLAAKDTGSNYDMMVVSSLMRRNELAAALTAIDKLAAKMPGSPIPQGLRGRVLLARKEVKEAAVAFEAALKADGAYLPAVLGLVMIDGQAGRRDEAIQRLETFVAAQPRATSARLVLADLLTQNRAPAEKVTAVLADAVRQDPADPTLRAALIDQRLRLGQVAAANQAAQEAVAALPQSTEVLERLARTQLMAGDKAQATKSYGKLASIAPTKAAGFMGLAQLRTIDNDFVGAEREVKRALEAEPGSQVAQRVAIQLAIRQARYDEALASLHKRQKDYPQEAFGFLAEADLELARQRPDAAVAMLRKAAALNDPVDAPARLFATLLANNKRDDALAFEGQWLAAHPKDQLFAAAAADVLLARGELETAWNRYEGLLKTYPDLISVINNVAWLRAKLGKPGGRELAERGLKLQPDYAPLRDTYATVLASDKDFAKALSVQRQLVSDYTDQPAYRLNLAQILIQSGDKAGAKQELQGLAKLGNKFPQQARVTELLKSLL